MSAPLAVGESILLIDGKGRHYLVKLTANATFQHHTGVIPHETLLATEEGGSVESSRGGRFTVLRPRLADFILKMPRGAQVVYPKDIGPLMMWADIGPGMTVLEAGTGSGALTLGLLRAVGKEGRVITVERRADHQQTAIRSIGRWLGDIPPNLDMRVGEVEAVMEEICPERIVLDLPEPWHAAEVAVRRQPGGGVFCCYLPTVPQVQTVVDVLRRSYVEVEVYETLHRTWNVSGRSVRPDHRMIGHTGFVTVARKVEEGVVSPSVPVVGEPEEAGEEEE